MTHRKLSKLLLALPLLVVGCLADVSDSDEELETHQSEQSLIAPQEDPHPCNDHLDRTTCSTAWECDTSSEGFCQWFTGRQGPDCYCPSCDTNEPAPVEVTKIPQVQ